MPKETPPVHRKRYRRTDHAGHNQKQQAEAEYRIGKVQRTNCGTPNKQGPCGQAHAPQWKRRLARLQGGFGRDSIGGNTNYIFTILHLSRSDLQRNRGTKGRLIRLRPTKGLLSCWCNTGVGGPGIDKAPGPLC